MDYKNGKIYRLVCNETGKQYVGSTTQPLHKRLYTHKVSFNLWKSGTNTRYYTSSFEVLDKGNFDIVLVEEYPCSNKEQLRSRERYYIELFECVNRRIPTRTKREWVNDNREKFNQHRRDVYEEKRKEQHTSYYEKNKETILSKQKSYRETNRDEISIRKKEDVICSCGKRTDSGHLSRHKTTKQHLKWLEEQTKP